VNNATLNRFFSLHFVLPFVIAALVLMHLIALHDSAGSSNPVGVAGTYDRVSFAPYFIFKDLITIFLFILVLSVFVFFFPNALMDSENYVMANPMQTPPAIVPEWYLLPFYAILRSIPNKLLGVIAMFAAILVLLTLPFTDLSRSRGLQFKPFSKIVFYIFVGNFLILMQLGAKHVESPYIEFGQTSTVLYFAYFLIIIPVITLFENTLMELPGFNSKEQNIKELAHRENKHISDYNLVAWFDDPAIRSAVIAFYGGLFAWPLLEDIWYHGLFCDAPRPWGLYFQDSATPQMEGLVELHDNILFYLVIILFGVGWILASIVKNYSYKVAPISHKYLNHGKYVPIKKCFKFNKINNNLYYIRLYSTTSEENVHSMKFYQDAYYMKKIIIKDNKNKSGIYKWTNKLTNDIYIGQSIDLAKRFIKDFNLSYLKNRETLVISRALIKYGYSNFSLEILEYCDLADLTGKEQYYLDKLNPRYNTLKIAGSSLGHKHTEETKAQISKSLKGIYVKEKSALHGRTHTEETKALMSIKRSNIKNPLFGKIHTEETKELMRQKALARKHSEETLLKISAARGYLVYIHEKCDAEGFKLIGSFVSIRRAAMFLDISSNTITRYINSGEIFKDKYKFTGH